MVNLLEEETDQILTKMEMDAIQEGTEANYENSPENAFEMQIWQDKPASEIVQHILNKDVVLGNINLAELKRAESYAYMCKIAEQQGWKQTYNFYYFKLYFLLNISNSVGGFARKIRQTHFHNIDRKSMSGMPQQEQSKTGNFVKGIFKKKSPW